MHKILFLSITGLLLLCGTNKDLPNDLNENWGKQITIPSWGNNAPCIEIRTPLDWKLSTVKGIDFDLNYLSDSINSGQMLIYIGSNPKNIESKENPIKHYVGKMRYNFYSSQQNGSPFKEEAIVSGFFKSKNNEAVSALLMHIVISSKNRDFNKNAYQSLSTLKLGK
jgi:hypothetical protein